MITANALICGKKIQLIVIKIMSLGYIAVQRPRNGGGVGQRVGQNVLPHH
ncbi:hypothetical protein [Symbiopectobacterium sp. RP]